MMCAQHGWYSYEDGCRGEGCEATVSHRDDCALVKHWGIKMVHQDMIDPDSPRWLQCCDIRCTCDVFDAAGKRRRGD